MQHDYEIKTGDSQGFDPSMNLALELKQSVSAEGLKAYAEENRKIRPLIMARPGGFKGMTVALCGAGPSLRDAVFDDVDMVFACNSALTYLLDKGVNVAAGIAIDQSQRMVEDWRSAPDVLYFLGSTVNPELPKLLRAADRDVIFFHNYCGWVDEFDYYCQEWPPCFMVGEGQTVVGRAIGLLDWMGFERIDVHGADCAFGEDNIVHADGSTVEDAYRTPLLLQAELKGRIWRSRADMLMAAVRLVRRARNNDKIRLIGDTLPNALIDEPDTFLDLVCRELTAQELASAQHDASRADGSGSTPEELAAAI